MITEQGRVVAVEKDCLWVETIQQSTCGSCVAQKGCGQSLLARIGSRQAYLRVLLDGRSPDGYKENDKVTVGIPDDVVVKSSLLAYLLPLAGLLLFALLADNWFTSELLVILTALAGLFMGGLLVALLSSRLKNNSRYQPKLLSRFDEDIDQDNDQNDELFEKVKVTALD